MSERLVEEASQRVNDAGSPRRGDATRATTPLSSRLWAKALLFDQGLFRFLYLNKHRVTGDLWRSAQPLPHHLRKLQAQGVKTIIKVRGGRKNPTWQLQSEACERLGLTLVELDIRSRAAPEREILWRADHLFETIAYPAIVHCKAGADRTGFVAALYLLLREGSSADRALKQLSFRYGHVRFAKAGILRAFFESYRDTGEADGIGFRDWMRERYDPETLEREFSSKPWANIVIDRVLGRE